MTFVFQGRGHAFPNRRCVVHFGLFDDAVQPTVIASRAVIDDVARFALAGTDKPNVVAWPVRTLCYVQISHCTVDPSPSRTRSLNSARPTSRVGVFFGYVRSGRFVIVKFSTQLCVDSELSIKVARAFRNYCPLLDWDFSSTEDAARHEANPHLSLHCGETIWQRALHWSVEEVGTQEFTEAHVYGRVQVFGEWCNMRDGLKFRRRE